MKSSLPSINIEAEKRVLGALLVSPDKIPDSMLLISESDFYDLGNRFIYQSMCRLDMDGKPVSAETIYQAMAKTRLDNGKPATNLFEGVSHIVELAYGVDVEELTFWAKEVKDRSEQRNLLDMLERARERVASSTGDMDSVRSKIEEQLVSLSGVSSPESSPIDASIDGLYARVQKYVDDPDSIAGLASGWDKLDQALDGWQRGNVTIVYAPTSRFKSLWTSNLGWRFAKQNIPGLWFTTEMPKIQVVERIMQLELGRNLKWLRRDKKVNNHLGEIKNAIETIKSYPIFFNDTSSLDVAHLRAEVARHKRWNNIEYVIVDLVDHIHSSKYRDEMVNNQRMVMQTMKGIAKDLDVHVILVSHVGKGERSLRNEPDLDVEDMLGTSAKYQDVDVSISLMPVRWHIEKDDWVGLSRQDILERIFDSGRLDVLISVTKNRHGELIRYLMELDWNVGGRFSASGNFLLNPESNPYLKIREEKQKAMDLDIDLAAQVDAIGD